ncbi:MAG: UPF0182 family protein [Vicinamibacterales bacterium]|jgi:hypothetical protein|nr:membrane protein [Acidobacteriota bacterium]MDP7472173.1 UPF0182 family protein [Vicinamibacterales bacterium]MDP7670879.1 UPF0182 family protein [Vicinamibacterales bacterium]HJO39624.1 UPF0182 family protein [Vicinamibacterales bacterium]|tara:strand:- start:2143 stop:4899 length:2757 start_codon:yes stop_codon:yes gene_type:complete
MSIRVPIIVAGVLLFLVVPSFADFYTDWLWFERLGFEQVFTRTLISQILLGVTVFVIAFGLLLGGLRLALQEMTKPYLVIGGGPDVKPLVVDRKGLRLIAAGVSGLAALFMGVFASGQWMVWLQYRYATPFGDADPLLGRDVAFYVFELPFLDFVRYLLVAIVVLNLAGAAAIYVSAGAVAFDPSTGLKISRRARQHLSLLVAAFLVLLAWGASIDIPRLLLTPAGVIQGASYVDVEARVPMLRLLVAVALLGGGLAAYQAFSPKNWPVPLAAILYVTVSAGGSGYSAFIQRIVVTPNEQEKEAPFIEYNVAATRTAFSLDAIDERELSGDALLARGDIEANSETINNVRLWDHGPLLDTFGQIQAIRSYYDFASVDNDRYVINGEYRQTMLSTRELNSSSLSNRTWPNERLVFTHGYGLALGPVNQVTAEGLPVLFLQDLPPRSDVDLSVDEPSIYFGELSNDYVIVNTNTREFHYPEGDDNVYSTFEGEGGVSIGGLLDKLLFSLRFRAFNILISEQLTDESRILFHRNISDRVESIAPFLMYDRDPYLVISEGQLFWIIDAYTVTDGYPYSSQATRGINYIRNSVKIVVNAYSGETTYYLADENDPIAATIGKIFPEFFTPLEAMSADLRSHVRYPQDIFTLQTAMFSTFHMTNPAVFYNKEDQWEVPAIDSEGRAAQMEPYYTIMKLPGEQDAEFIQMLPFTPRRKDNLAAWMVARSDGEHYGKLMVFQFPKQKLIFGPRQIVARINQDQEISPQITLWNQQGSQVIQGTLLVVPIEESLLYIRPLYLRAADGQIPELKRVIVAYQNQIVMEETLALALDRLFGRAGAEQRLTSAAPVAQAAPPPVLSLPAQAPAPTAAVSSLADEARQHYDRAIQAQRAGDWTLYGAELDRLGEILELMAAPTGAETQPSGGT